MNFPEDAACNGVDTNVFVIHVKPHNTAAAATRTKMMYALAICASCPVIAECAVYMVGWPEPPRDIVIAAMTPQQARAAWMVAHGRAPHRHTKRIAS